MTIYNTPEIPNILEAMREVEAAAERATPRPWGSETFGFILEDALSSTNIDYIYAAANHAPGIVAFARRLLEVARAVGRCYDVRTYRELHAALSRYNAEYGETAPEWLRELDGGEE